MTAFHKMQKVIPKFIFSVLERKLTFTGLIIRKVKCLPCLLIKM